MCLVMNMEELCVEIIDNVEELLKSDIDYKDILEYLESKKVEIKAKKDDCSEYIDGLMRELK